MVRFQKTAGLTALSIALMAVTTVSCGGPSSPDRDRGLALVYRGAAACPGCAETIAQRLETTFPDTTVAFIGEDEEYPLEASSLTVASLYVQPGGGDDVAAAADSIPGDYIEDLEQYVSAGGNYLGVCMGAYLAGPVAFGLIDDDIDGEVGRRDFDVTDSRETFVDVSWNGVHRQTFFQEGAVLPEPSDSDAVFARYANSDVAAAGYSHGSGSVGLIGPHPEADETWTQSSDIADPDGDDWDHVVAFIDPLLP